LEYLSHPFAPFALVALMTLAVPVTEAKVIYVNGNLNTDPVSDGLTWLTAFNTVQGGIESAREGDDVWVVATTYFENITLANGVAIYGGFDGTETERAQRNWTNNITILDGRQTNSVIVLRNATNENNRVDGFVIRNGNGLSGGGIRCLQASLTVANNVITNCKPYLSSSPLGGGAYCFGSSMTITNNHILGNRAYMGAGIYSEISSLVISYNLIQDNSAWNSGGGGIVCDRSVGVISDNVICRNQAVYSGGGVALASSSMAVSKNRISENSASFGGGLAVSGGLNSPKLIVSYNEVIGNTCHNPGGGGIYCDTVDALVLNNLVVSNTSIGAYGAGGIGGGIYCTKSPNWDATTRLYNNTIIGNNAKVGSGLYDQEGSAWLANNLVCFNISPTTSSYGSGVHGVGTEFRNNCVFGNSVYNYGGNDLTGTNGNISVDPLLVSTNDFHISAGSPCIDAGDDSIIEAGWLDLDGQTRRAGAHVDIGADEFGSGMPFFLTLLGTQDTGHTRLRLTGEVGRVYLFQSSPDLTKWTTVTTNQATNATLDVSDPTPAELAPRFYRALTP
jgi:hypothetical protein